MQNLRLAVFTALLLSGLLGGCASIDAAGNLHKDPAALSGDYSGKDFSGSFAVVRLPEDIPGVPESHGAHARWSETEKQQVLFFDGDCQKQLFEQLPGWAQAIAKESGWSALAVAVGEGGFAAAFPGAEVTRYFLGGLGYGAAAGLNTGRYRQDGAEKGSIGYCVLLQAWEAKSRYHILQGINFVPWYGNGHTSLPAATDNISDPTLPYTNSGGAPPLR